MEERGSNRVYIKIEEVNKYYDYEKTKLKVLEDVSLDINKGEFICIIGPSGCGKSTLLNAVAGFEKIDSGLIEIDNKMVIKPTPRYLTIFQNYGLLPWRSVVRNVELGLEVIKVDKKKRREKALKYINLVGLGKFENSYPYQLSGGMQQRVALARALLVEPEILFMDEPFGALDAITRIKMQNDILEISKKNNLTVLFVTHDIEEAVYLADRIVVMSPNPGKIKTIVNVKKSFTNNRNSPDFLAAREKMLKIFNMTESIEIEYTI